MKNIAFAIFTLLFFFQGKAQLVSERPLSSIYSEAVKQKLNKSKGSNGNSVQLPSDAPLPKQVIQAQSNRPVPRNGKLGKEVHQAFPSNSNRLSIPIRTRKK